MVSSPSNATSGDCPEWLNALRTQGYAVVPNVLTPKVSQHYADQMLAWVEDWKLGYKRNDPQTWERKNLPSFVKGGLFQLYGVAHEQFAWDIRQDPAVIDVFAKVWGTDELVVSFDGINVSVPLKDPREGASGGRAPWPHTDQSPLKSGFQCVQGIVNLVPNGPDDGGLCVLKGSSALFAEVFKAFAKDKPADGWNAKDSHIFTDEQMEWLFARGCRWEKVCCGPGDVLLWDSRTVHYGAAPSSTSHRLATYVCYKPAALLSPEDRKKKIDAWERKVTTSHDPIVFTTRSRVPPKRHFTFAAARTRPKQAPVLSERGRLLVGLDSYKDRG